VIWKTWATPWGQSRLKPRARVRFTGATDIGLSPTAATSTGRPDARNAAMTPRRHVTNLTSAPVALLWGTPRVTTNGGYGSPNAPEKARLEDQVHTVEWNGLPTNMEKAGQLSPEFVGWLMGYPVAEWLFARHRT